MTNPGHIFISYARKDGLEHATRLEQALNQQGYATWRDIRKLEPEQDFTAQIEQAIEQAAWVVVCITPDVKRGDSFVRREIQYALVVKKPVLVARFGDVPPPIHVIDNTWIEFWKDWSLAERQLLSNLQKTPVEVTAPASNDPFRPYVERLLKTSVNFLQKTVITLIDVESAASPEAVEGKAPEVDMLAQLFEAHELKDEAAEKSEFKTFAEAFEHYHGRVLLLGEPGAGKTITLMATTREAATRRLDDPNQPLPLFGLIPTWDAYKQPSLMDWLVGALPELKGSEAAKGLRDEDVLFLLDGLDELPESRPVDPKKPEGETFNPRIRFLDAVEHSSAKMIVSCRIEDYKTIWQKAALDGAVTLKRLTDGQVQAFLGDLPLLWQVISADGDLLDISKTPLLLGIMAFAFREQPENLQQLADLKEGELRDAVFNAYLRERYEHERRKFKAQGLTLPFELDALIRDLGWMAMVNAAGGQNVIENVVTRRDFWRVVGSYRSSEFILFCQQLNLILEIESSQTWRFIHLRLRDALAYGRAEKLIDGLLQSTYEFAIGGLGGVKDTRSVPKLLQLLRDEDHEVRSHAAEALGKIGDSRAVERLLQLLSDEDISVRRYTAEALGKIGDSRAVEGLLRLLSDEDVSVRRYAAMALGEIGDSRAVEGLLQLLSDEDVSVRRYTAEALGEIGDSRAVEGLLQLLSDEDVSVRWRAALELGEIGDSRAVEGLLRLLGDEDEDDNVRSHAALALGEIRDAQAVEGLLRLLGDEDEDDNVRGQAAMALGKIGDAEAVEGLLRLLSDKDEYVADHAAAALQIIGNEETLWATDKYLKNI